MSPAEELDSLERQISRLRLRMEHQAMHVEGLAEYPQLAERAEEILAEDAERLRRTLIRFAEVKADMDREKPQAATGKSGAA